MKYIYFVSLLILASAVLSSAQLDGSGLSQNCKDALTKIIGDKDVNACFPFLSAASVVLENKTDSDSLTKTADAICGVPKCSDDLVSKTRSDFETACQADITSGNDSAKFVYYILLLYSPTRDSLCFNNSTGGYCFIESYTSAYSVYQANPNQSELNTFTSAPKEVVCTPCNKAILNTYFNYQQSNPDLVAKIKELSSSDINNIKVLIGGKCGSSFLDGQIGDSKMPPSQFLNQLDTKDNKPNSAMSLVANRLVFVALVASVFATL